MPKLFMLRGLPASGKSTKRNELMLNPSFSPIVAVNKDTIRRGMGIVPGDFSKEKEVLATETQLIEKTLRSGANLIVDNTHNSPKYLKKYQDLAREHDYEFVLIDLSDVPVEECIRRDALRTGHEHVGEKVILDMYNQFYNKGEKLKPQSKPKPKVEKKMTETQPVPMVQDRSLPTCLIVDLDGTLARATDRSYYQYWKCETDDLVEHIHMLVAGLVSTVNHVVFLTGREDSGWDATVRWLADKAGFVVDGQKFHLVMKNTGDHRPDIVAKRELFDNYVRDKFYVVAVFEDRSRVVKMWREMGLTCLQVVTNED